MFRFTRKLSSESHSQYLAKITHSVQGGYMEVVQTMSVLWLHSMTCEACVHSISWTMKFLISLMQGVTVEFNILCLFFLYHFGCTTRWFFNVLLVVLAFCVVTVFRGFLLCRAHCLFRRMAPEFC